MNIQKLEKREKITNFKQKIPKYLKLYKKKMIQNSDTSTIYKKQQYSGKRVIEKGKTVEHI